MGDAATEIGELGALRSFAALNLSELGYQLPRATVQIGLYSCPRPILEIPGFRGCRAFFAAVSARTVRNPACSAIPVQP